MNREELVEKMASAYEEGAAFPLGTPHGIHAARVKGMAAALDVAVGELASALEKKYPADSNLPLSDAQWIRSRYQKPKSDPAVEAVKVYAPQVYLGRDDEEDVVDRWANRVVAAVRKADHDRA